MNKEFAIVMDKSGQPFLVETAQYNGGKLPSFAEKLLIHSHPYDFGSGMAKKISPEDIMAIKILKQEYSYMVTADGMVWKFTQKTAPHGPGQLVREMNYYGWGKPKGNNPLDF